MITPLQAPLPSTHPQHPGRQRRSPRVPHASQWRAGARGCPLVGFWGGNASSLRLGRSRSCSSQDPRPRQHGLGTPAGPAWRGVQGLGLASHRHIPSTGHLPERGAARNCQSTTVIPSHCGSDRPPSGTLPACFICLQSIAGRLCFLWARGTLGLAGMRRKISLGSISPNSGHSGRQAGALCRCLLTIPGSQPLETQVPCLPWNAYTGFPCLT